MLTKDDFIIQGFNCIHLTSRDIGGRACGGVSVMARDAISYSECILYTSLQAKAVTISTSKTITVCSLYLPPSENLNIVLLTRLIAQLPTPFVICGDFNGHSMTWGCDKNNSRRDRINDFITENNCLLVLCCLPTPMALASGGSPMFPLVVHQPASPSIWPAVQSLRRGLSTNPGATMWCVCGCS